MSPTSSCTCSAPAPPPRQPRRTASCSPPSWSSGPAQPLRATASPRKRSDMRARTPRGVAAIALAATGTLALAACGGGGFSGGGQTAAQNTSKGPVKLTVMIGSSGDAETNAVKEATQAWATKTGNTVEVIAASDLGQQLGQAFASTSPPDLFYTDASKIGTFAKAGNLY